MVILQHRTRIGNRLFYINKLRDGSINYNSVNGKTNRTYHYKNATLYYKAFKKAKSNIK